MILVDAKHWPLLLLRYEGTVSLAEVEDCLTTFDRLAVRKQRFVSVSDISRVHMPSGDVLRRYAKWHRENQDLLRTFCLGSATIAPSALVRGILKAVNWLQPSPEPQVVVATLEEGLRFVEDRLTEGRLALPKSAVSLTRFA